MQRQPGGQCIGRNIIALLAFLFYLMQHTELIYKNVNYLVRISALQVKMNVGSLLLGPTRTDLLDNRDMMDKDIAEKNKMAGNRCVVLYYYLNNYS